MFWPRALVVASLTGSVVVVAAACRPAVDGRQEEHCFQECQAKAGARCDDWQCARGCRFILDRLVEHVGSKVVACVAKEPAPAKCGDETWALCAARIGPHADGGPPNPTSAPDEPEPEHEDKPKASR